MFFVLGQKLDIFYGEYDVWLYLVINVFVSLEVVFFIVFFEESNVGNLWVYLYYDDELFYEYLFKGKEILELYYEMFVGIYCDLLEDDVFYVYSIYSIKGNRVEYYLICMFFDKGLNIIVLFDLNGEVMELVQVLAYVYCKGDFCYQQDSFIIDLDGDIDFDILIKFCWIEVDDEEMLVKNDIVYLQEDDGFFEMVLDNELCIDKDVYNMKVIEFEE